MLGRVTNHHAWILSTILPEAERKRAESLQELAHIHAISHDSEVIFSGIKAYQPEASDVVITPYAKSGTTWLQQIFPRHTERQWQRNEKFKIDCRICSTS